MTLSFIQSKHLSLYDTQNNLSKFKKPKCLSLTAAFLSIFLTVFHWMDHGKNESFDDGFILRFANIDHSNRPVFRDNKIFSRVKFFNSVFCILSTHNEMHELVFECKSIQFNAE